jgi:hypothetical protein
MCSAISGATQQLQCEGANDSGQSSVPQQLRSNAFRQVSVGR